MNRSKPPLHKKNKNVPARGRKPILSASNRAKIASDPIKQTISKVVGSGLSLAARAVIGSIFGKGDYKVNYNSLSGAGGPPQFSSVGSSRSTVVVHREFVQDIVGSTAFNLQSFVITPTNSKLFPWLAQLSANFEEYRIHGMIFEFKTTSGMSVSSTNTALGTVIMATQYNPNDVAFTNKINMENYEFATSGGPFENFLHPLECKPQLTVAPQLYVNQPVTPGAVVDSRLTNFGTFSIATVGMQAANSVGELWISYQVELLKPRLTSLIVGNGGVEVLLNSNLSQTNPFGTAGSTIQSFTIVGPTNGERSCYAPNETFSAANGAITNTLQLVGTAFNLSPSPVTPLNAVIIDAAGVIRLPTGFSWLGHTLQLTYTCKGTGLGAITISPNVNTATIVASGLGSTDATLASATFISQMTSNTDPLAVTVSISAATTITNALLTFTILN